MLLASAPLLCSDMPLTAPPDQVAAAFNALNLSSDPQQRNQTLQQFVAQASARWPIATHLLFLSNAECLPWSIAEHCCRVSPESQLLAPDVLACHHPPAVAHSARV
jgi:hypothetical protein